MQDEMEAPAADAPVKAKRKTRAKTGVKTGAKTGDKAALRTSRKAGRAATRAAAGEARKSAGKSPKNPEIQIARMMVRAQWLQEWTAANPDAAQADRQAAWKELRQPQMEANFRTARKVLTSLQRQGVSLALSATAATDDDAADADTDA